MEFGKSQEQKGGYSGSIKRQKESPLCNIDGRVSPQKRGVRTTNYKKYQGRVVLRGDIVKDDSAHAVFPEEDSSASLMTAANVMDVYCKVTRL